MSILISTTLNIQKQEVTPSDNSWKRELNQATSSCAKEQHIPLPPNQITLQTTFTTLLWDIYVSQLIYKVRLKQTEEK